MGQAFTTRWIWLVAAAMTAGCSTSQPNRSIEPEQLAFEPFDLPLEFNEHGVASVTIETSVGAIELVLDTGADQAILLQNDATIAEELERVDTEWHFSADGRLQRTAVYRFDEVRLGPLTFSEVRAPVEATDLPDFFAGQGMLGRALLEGLTLDIDVPGRRLGILPPGQLPDGFDPRAWYAIPLLSMDDGPVIPVHIDGSTRELHMVVDTGAIANGPGGFYGIVELPSDLPQPTEKHRGLPVYRAQSVRLGDLDIGSMHFFVMHYPEPPGTHGFLGNVLTERYRILIEPHTSQMYIHLPADLTENAR